MPRGRRCHGRTGSAELQSRSGRRELPAQRLRIQNCRLPKAGFRRLSVPSAEIGAFSDLPLFSAFYPPYVTANSGLTTGQPRTFAGITSDRRGIKGRPRPAPTEQAMTELPKRSMFAADGVAAPLRHAVFRRIWLASLLSNLGLLIQRVGAAWAMTQMTSSPDIVALVQTALMLPVMLISMPAGAIADMYDRRIVALVSLSIGLAGATALSVLAWLGLVTPQILLAFCFIVGSGMALFGPAWQSSVSEQVPAETLPSAVALNGISYNIARSFGPAIGGIVVATAGAGAAFALNALLYIPLLVVPFLWRRTSQPP